MSKDYRILVCARTSDEVTRRMAWYLVNLHSSKLNAHRHHDLSIYSLHGHTFSDPNRFNHGFHCPHFPPLKETLEYFGGPSAAIGSTLYTFCDIADNKLRRFDVSTAVPNWELVKSPTLSSGEFPRRLVALGGLLFLPGVTRSDSEFGVIFNPSTAEWTGWRQPDGVEIKIGYSLRVVSLGESSGQILVTNGCHFQSVYDIGKEIWDMETFKGLMLWNINGEPVSVEEHTTIYWINDCGTIFGYNWKTQELDYGPIIGLEGEGRFSSLVRDNVPTPLLHLGGDLFCLLWWDYNDIDRKMTDLHCSIARVIKRDLPYTLAMIVVGCFRTTVRGKLDIDDAFLM